MSIMLYTGTPGSGKSYHAAREIVSWLRRGKPLVANFPVDVTAAKKKCKAKAEYRDNSELSAEWLVAYSMEHLKFAVEHQCLVVIDECQVIFNCRDFGRKDRNAWVQLFSQHRKLGFDLILITQSDRMMDKQIRYLVENEVKHRKLNNYGIGGTILSLLTGFKTWFVALDYWYGGNKLLLGKSIFRYNKKYEKVYDSYRLFADMAGSAGAGVCAGGNREAVGPRGTAPAPPAAEQAGKGVMADDEQGEQCKQGSDYSAGSVPDQRAAS